MSPRFPVNDLALFKRAVRLLKTYSDETRAVSSTPNFSVAIAALMHRSSPAPRRRGPADLIGEPGSPLLRTLDLQVDVCDRTYEKERRFLPRNAEGPIYKLFTNSFKPRSPQTNNWRNSFDTQRGLGCDAPNTDRYLRSETFLAESRFDCEFRNSSTGRCSSPAGRSGRTPVCFNPNKRGTPPGPDDTTALPPPKLLIRGEAEQRHGFWLIEPTEHVLADLLADITNRVPLFPFLIALYAGSPYFRRWRRTANEDRLRDDLMLTNQQFAVLFDCDPANRFNRALVIGNRASRRASGSVHNRSQKVYKLAKPTKFSPGRDIKAFESAAQIAPDPLERLTLLEKAARGHARALEALAAQLTEKGYSPTEQFNGYDLFVEVAKEGFLFEIKTWRADTLKHRIRYGLAQLYEYRWRNAAILPKSVHLLLVLDRKPPSGEHSWLWEFLAEDRGVTPGWMSDGKLETLSQHRDKLSWLYPA